MRKILFKDNKHKIIYKTLMNRLPKTNQENRKMKSIMYLIAWVESDHKSVADQIFDFETLSINPYIYIADWQTEMTQNAIWLAHNIKINCYDCILNILEASDWNKYFFEAVRIGYENI